jgi:hypothetical protein
VERGAGDAGSSSARPRLIDPLGMLRVVSSPVPSRSGAPGRRRPGEPPANFVACAGFENERRKPLIEHYNEAIERTHRLTGMPRQEIFERGWGPDASRRIPIYGLGGLSLLDFITGMGSPNSQ